VGLQIDVLLPAGTEPDFATILAKLAAFGDPPALKMIDGLPAFPDEVPEAGWRELRLGLAAGMVTLRRMSDGLAIVTWGSADSALAMARNRVAWAAASAGAGSVREGGTTLTPEAFFAAGNLGPMDATPDTGR
jgi:hypothetical protein